MRRPWEKHLAIAVVLAALAFAVGELVNVMLGAVLAAAAGFVALRPLFRKDRERPRE